MPRVYRRYRGKRYYRRSKVLSTRNVFGNRGGKAQARQISALTHKVRKMERRNKPQAKVYIYQPTNVAFSSASGSEVSYTFNSLTIGKGTADHDRTGDIVRRKDHWYFNFEYYNTSNIGFHDSEASGACIRVIVGQYKSAVSDTLTPNPEQLISNFAASGVGYTQAAIAPLLNGVTQTYRIMSDRKYTITSDRNQKMIHVVSPYYTCRYTDEVAGRSNHAFCMVVVTDLHWDVNFAEVVKGTCSRKVVFYNP